VAASPVAAPGPSAAVAASASPSASAAGAGATAGPKPTGDILVFAASSLTESFNEIGQAFMTENPGTRVAFNFAASSTLQVQLNQGGQADAFASADEIQMGIAQQNGDLANAPVVFAHNLLTIITPAANPANIHTVCDLANPGVKIVAVQPSVPVGQYTDEMFAKASTPDQCGTDFQAKANANIVSREDNVRQLVAKVQLGEADAGVCYLTDVTPQIKPNVQEIQIPPELNSLASYPIATTRGRNPAGGQAFMNFVLSPAGQDILAKWGFIKGVQ
jgi:molybdate transport system substrate-binding protein